MKRVNTVNEKSLGLVSADDYSLTVFKELLQNFYRISTHQTGVNLLMDEICKYVHEHPSA